MNVKKHPQLNLNLAILRTLPPFRPLATLLVFLSVSCSAATTASLPQITTVSNPYSSKAKRIKRISGTTASLPQTTTARTFADWCLNKNNLSVQTKHTVDVLLQEAQTQDCHRASKLLSTRTELSLNNNQITDLKPLSSLTKLTYLVLDNNQIADLKPLSSLTKLTYLVLDNNQ
jgi:internalin A